MARYRKIDPRIWRDKKFRSLSNDGQLVWFLLLTAPQSTSLPGVYCAGLSSLSESTTLPQKRLREGFREAKALGMFEHDADGPIIWVPNVIRYDPPQSINVVKSWKAVWHELPESWLLPEIFKHFKAYMEGMSEGFLVAFLEAFAKPCLIPAPAPAPEPEPEPTPEPTPTQTTLSGSAPDSSPSLREPDRAVVQIEPATQSSSEPIRQVFAHYRKYHPRAHRSPVSTSREWRAIKARLGEGYSAEDLCQSIDGCHASPFHQGENERGRKYDSLELIMRDGSKVQQFMECWDQRNEPVLTERNRRNSRAIDQWVEQSNWLERKTDDVG